MFDSQRGEVRVGNQGAYGLSSGQKPGQNFPVALGGKDERGDWDGKQTVDDGAGLRDLKRPAQCPRIRRDSKKREKRGPAECDGCGASQGFLQPAPSPFVLY